MERGHCALKFVHGHWHPIPGTPNQTRLRCFTVIVWMDGLPNEHGPVVQAERVDDGAGSGRCFANRSDINPALAAQQIVRGAGSETIFRDQRPICPNVGLSSWVGRRARSMRAAERTCARAYPKLGRRQCQPQPDAKASAMTAALMLHGTSSDASSCLVRSRREIDSRG